MDYDFEPIRELFEETISRGELPGGFVIILKGENVIYEEAFGYADIEKRTPFTADTPVKIASISKPLVGTMAFRVAQAGQLDLTKPITYYLPEFKRAMLESGEPLSRAPTTIELLSHMSGMPEDGPGGLPWGAEWTVGNTLKRVVQRYARDFPFKTQPGEKNLYTGVGIDTAARVVEAAAGIPRNELFRQQVAIPLGMTKTCYDDVKTVQFTGKRTPRYYRRHHDGKVVPGKKRAIPPANTYSSSGGGIYSTANDLIIWLSMIRNSGMHERRPFLQLHALKAMLSPVPGSRQSRGGFFIRKKNKSGVPRTIGHSGSIGTNCWLDFERDMIGITLTQMSGDNDDFLLALSRCVKKCVER